MLAESRRIAISAITGIDPTSEDTQTADGYIDQLGLAGAGRADALLTLARRTDGAPLMAYGGLIATLRQISAADKAHNFMLEMFAVLSDYPRGAGDMVFQPLQDTHVENIALALHFMLGNERRDLLLTSIDRWGSIPGHKQPPFPIL